MILKRKTVIAISMLILLILLAIVVFWRWQRAEPRKPDPIPPGDYTYSVDYAEYRIDQLMKQHHLPSVAVALIDDQDTVWQKAFGLANVEKEIPATVDTVYKLWSISKVFTAIETMRLVEEGLVDLDAPITDTIPDFSIQSRFPDSEPITIRSILAHHSGLPRNECHSLMSGPADYDVLGEMAESLKDCHMAFPVGYRYKYINIGPDVLGHIIQELRGEYYPRYMKENLLAPVGMENSAFLSTGIPAKRDVALGYEYYKGEYYPYEQGDITHLPSGNLYSTLEDMSAFAKFVFRGGEANGEQVIDRETLMLMFEDQFSSQRDPQPMGLGWKRAPVFGSELLVWHDGGPGEGIGSLVALLPERKLGVVLFANEISFEGSISVFLANEILERMLETKYGVTSPEDETSEPVDIDRSLLDDYEGRYVAFGQVMDVFLSGDRLKGKIQGMKFDLIPVGQTEFQVSHWLLNLGLADLLQLPIDLRELEIEFLAGDEAEEDVMIINMGDISYEICPRYPEFTDIPALWQELAGVYELVERLSSGNVGSEIIGRDEIVIEDGVLRMPGVIGPLKPISETEIIILGGPFAGETMVYEPGTGYIYHQWVVYKPIEADLNRE
ncbi:MAG: serine hydrolase domain-containing protein [Chloroflexota bacterium]|nr:serine hydrolase domain-containing protein [Chloroflexota bacterium]